MRTFAPGTRSLLLGTLLFSILFIAAPTTHAQTATTVAPANASIPCGTLTCTAGQTCLRTPGPDGIGSTNTCVGSVATADGGTQTTGTTQSALTTNTNSTTQNAAGAVTAQSSNSNTTLGGGGGTGGDCNLILNLGGCLLNAVANFIMTLSGFILGIVGVLLNLVTVKTVFQFSQLIGNSAGLIAAWKILRDIGNLVLLFGFVLMGIGTILDTSKLPDKKAIPMLIIFAILLNFSIFASEAVIDTSNAFTSVMYAQANTSPCLDDNCIINNGIAGSIMQATGLSGIYKSEANRTISNKVLVIIGIALFSTIGTVVLLAAAIMLAFRAITLTGLIIVSPIGFAGMAIPQFQGIAKKWWSLLIHQSFFAPILFLLIFVDLKVTSSFSSLGGANAGLADALSNTTSVNVGNLGIIMVFMLICGGLIAALMAAKSFGAMGASFAVNTATKFTFGAGNLATSGTARLARIGVQRSPIGDTKAGRFITTNFLSPVERGALDSRRLSGVSTVLKAAGATDAAKSHDSLKEVGDKAKDFFVERPKAANKQYDEERAAQRTKDKKGQLNKDIASGDLSGSERFLAGLSGKDLETIPAVRQGNPAVIRALSPDQFESLMKSDNLSSSEKGKISDARFGDLRTQIDTGDRAGIRQWSNKDLQQLAKSNATLFNDVIAAADPVTGASYLSDDQQENLMKSDSLTPSQRKSVRSGSVVGRIEAAVEPGGLGDAEAERLARTLNPKQKVKLGVNALKNGSPTTGVISTLTAGDLAKIMEDGKLLDVDKAKIAAAVKNPAHANFASIKKYLDGNTIAAAYWI